MKDLLEFCFIVVVSALGIALFIGLVHFVIGISPLIFVLMIFGAVIYAVWKIIEKIFS